MKSERHLYPMTLEQEDRTLRLGTGEIVPVTHVFAGGDELRFEDYDVWPNRIAVVAGPCVDGQWIAIGLKWTPKKKDH